MPNSNISAAARDGEAAAAAELATEAAELAAEAAAEAAELAAEATELAAEATELRIPLPLLATLLAALPEEAADERETMEVVVTTATAPTGRAPHTTE